MFEKGSLFDVEPGSYFILLRLKFINAANTQQAFHDHEQPAAEKEEDTKVIKVVTFINLHPISCNTKNYMHCKNRLINCP